MGMHQDGVCLHHLAFGTNLVGIKGLRSIGFEVVPSDIHQFPRAVAQMEHVQAVVGLPKTGRSRAFSFHQNLTTLRGFDGILAEGIGIRVTVI